MKVANIKLNSTAEVKEHFADIIFFQGCKRNCGYCFNPELKSFDGGTKMTADDICNSLSDMSDVVVLTGGEPLIQNIVELGKLITRLKFKRKKVVVETSMYHPLIVGLADKVLYTIKTFDINTKDLLTLRDMSNIDFCIVVGHNDFNMDGFKLAHKLIRKNIYHRFAMDIPVRFMRLYQYVKSIGKDFTVFRKIVL